MIRLALLTLLLADPPVGFGRVLREVIQASASGFAKLKGPKIEMNGGRKVFFEARAYLPGAAYCWVEYREDVYRCEWTPAAGLHRRLAAQIEKALGPEWQRRGARFRSETAEVEVSGTVVSVRPLKKDGAA